MIESGERPTDCCARYNFAIVSQDLGLRVPQRFCKHGRGPRIHDLRHTFAVNTLLGWYRNGVNVQARLHSLSTYMGHRQPRSTYLYLSAAPELLAYAAGLLEAAQEVAP